MKTNVVNTVENLEAMLAEAQPKRIKARTITIRDILDALAHLTYWMETFTTATDAVGTEVTIDVNARTFPHAYKGSPESTLFDAKYTSSGWKITRIYRYFTIQSNKRNADVKLTKATKEHMYDYMMANANF